MRQDFFRVDNENCNYRSEGFVLNLGGLLLFPRYSPKWKFQFISPQPLLLDAHLGVRLMGYGLFSQQGLGPRGHQGSLGQTSELF